MRNTAAPTRTGGVVRNLVRGCGHLAVQGYTEINRRVEEHLDLTSKMYPFFQAHVVPRCPEAAQDLLCELYARAEAARQPELRDAVYAAYDRALRGVVDCALGLKSTEEVRALLERARDLNLQWTGLSRALAEMQLTAALGGAAPAQA